MALEGRTESNSRSLHWAPLRSWNLFSGRVRSRASQDSRPSQLPRSQSVRNNGEGGRVGSSSNRSYGRPRSSDTGHKGGTFPRRDNRHSLREGIHRQSEPSVARDYSPSNSTEPSGRRQALQDRSSQATDVWSLDHTARPSEQIAHHQQHHHHDHHHHHYHYHHLYRQPPRRMTGLQDQALRISLSEMATSSRSNYGSSHDHEPLLSNSSQAGSSSRNAAMEARDRLDERLRGANLQRDRHNSRGAPAGLSDDIRALFDDEGVWSDDEVWELHVQYWGSRWGQAEDVPPDSHTSPGLSRTLIKELPKEVFVPLARRDEEMRDALMEQEDCAVCLDRFLAGQLLIRLPCEHRFHPDCLTPWLESRGQCPYCRAKVGQETICNVSSSRGPSVSSNNDLLARVGLSIRL